MSVLRVTAAGASAIGGYITALGLTIAIELPLVLLVLRRAPRLNLVFFSLLGNVFTHLSIHFILARLHFAPSAFEIVAESFAFAVEAALYAAAARPLSAWYAIAASALANGASYVVGILLSL